MACDRLERYLNEHECAGIEKNGELHRHAAGCRDCKKYLTLVNILSSQKEVFEKAPETILLSVRQQILERQNRGEHFSLPDIFGLLAKPALGFAVLLAAAILFLAYIKNSPIGVVDNLADRFNIAELKNIKTGDVLYVAKQIHVDVTLNGRVKLELDSNTVLQLRARNKISLFRGQVYIADEHGAMEVETPNGLITMKNAKAKIQVTINDPNGKYKSQTSCSVIDGSAEIGNVKEKVTVTPGQEIIFAENGKIRSKNALPDSAVNQQASRIGFPSKSKVFTAKEQLCNCLYDIRYDLNNNQLHAKEMKENKFPVRIFWQNRSKFESMRRPDETLCYFNTAPVPDRTRYIGSGPGI